MDSFLTIISVSDNRQAHDLLACAVRMAPGRVSLVDGDIGARVRFSMSNNVLTINGQSLADTDRLFLHGFEYMDPVVPSCGHAVDWSVWRQDYLIEQQRFSILFSAVSEAQRRGVAVYNPVSAQVLAFQRGELLTRMGAAGIAVPDTLVTNDRRAADDFRNRHSGVLWRPVCGRAAWQLFTELQAEDLVATSKPPILLADLVDGPARWAYVLDDRLLFNHGLDPAWIHPPESLEAIVALPETGFAGAIIGAVKASGLRWARVMYVEHADGVVIYDMDPDPLLEWQPTVVREFLLESLARALLNLPALECPGDLLNSAVERPTLFMRRMLGILFEMEATKYPSSEIDQAET